MAVMQLLSEEGSAETEKIVAAARHSGVSLEIIKGGCDHTPCGLPVPELRLPGGTKLRHLGAILRRVAQSGPLSEGAPLTGNSFIEEGQVDSWLEWVSLEVDHSGDDLDVKQVCGVLEAHLRGKCFLVGDHLSLADISAAISLRGPLEKAGLPELGASFPSTVCWLRASLAAGAGTSAGGTAGVRRRAAGAGGGRAPLYQYTASKTGEQQPAAVYWAWFQKSLRTRLLAASAAAGVGGAAAAEKAILAAPTADGVCSTCLAWGRPMSETEELHLRAAPVSKAWLQDLLQGASA